MADVPTLLEHNLGDPKKLQEQKEEQDHKALESNPNNDAFWTQRGLKRPDDLDEAIKEGQRIPTARRATSGSPSPARATCTTRSTTRRPCLTSIITASARWANTYEANHQQL